MFRTLVLWKLVVLLLPLILAVLEVEFDTTYLVPWNLSCLLRIWNGYVLLISISLCYVVRLSTLTIGTLATSTLK